MKNKIKLIGLIAVAALTAFAFAGCGNDTTTGGGGVTPQTVTYTGTAESTAYSLKITENTSRASYTPQGGDSYQLTSSGKTSTGSVNSFTGGVFTLKPSNSTTTFTTTVSGTGITAMAVW